MRYQIMRLSKRNRGGDDAVLKKSIAFVSVTVAILLSLLVPGVSTAYADENGSVVASGSCGSRATWTMYESGLFVFGGSGDVLADSNPYEQYESSVKAVEVEPGITSFGNFSLGFKNALAIFFKGSKTPGYQTYFKQYAFSGLNRDCKLYYNPGDTSWEDGEIGWNFNPWVEGMFDIDWASTVEFESCGATSFWVLNDGGQLSIRGAGAVSESVHPDNRKTVTSLVVEAGITELGDEVHFNSESYTGYPNLEQAFIADTVQTLPNELFKNASTLKEVQLPSVISSIPDEAFSGCSSLSSIEIPASVTSIGSEAFKDCTALSTMQIPAGVTSIAEGAFCGCSSLFSIELPTGLISIGKSVFEECSALASIALPESLAFIEARAFYGSGITGLTIPASVKSFDVSALSECGDLLQIDFAGAMPQLTGSYAGPQIKATHRTDDETWDSADKFVDGIAWYTRLDDGSLYEDDYISPYPGESLAAGEIKTNVYSDKDVHAYSFRLETPQRVTLSWLQSFGHNCIHRSFTVSLIDAHGNQGSRIAFWMVDHDSDSFSQTETLDLAAGPYVIEVRYSDTHSNSSFGSMSIEWNREVVSRLAGDGRYATMSAVVDAAFPGKADTVILASGEKFPDALSASALAGALDAPVILTGFGDLHEAAAWQISRLAPKQIIAAGSNATVSDAALTQASKAAGGAKTERVAGAGRYDTSLEIVKRMLDVSGWSTGGENRVLLIATGEKFPDSLSASSYAYATESPVLLCSKNGLSSEQMSVIKQLFNDGAVNEAVILGGPDGVPDAVQTALKKEEFRVTRIAGAGRYDTGIQFAKWSIKRGALTADRAVVATGENFPDALAGGALAGTRGAVLVLASGNNDQAISYLAQAGAKNATILGSTAAVPQSLEDALNQQLA